MGRGDNLPELAKARGYTKADFKKFKSLTDFVVGKFGLEPRWHITFQLAYADEFEAEHGESQAFTYWPEHYRSAIIGTSDRMIVERKLWLFCLLHELVHVVMADLQDFNSEAAGKYEHHQLRDINETTVSELANIYYAVMLEGYPELARWL